MNDQLIPKVSLARLIRYTTRNCYKELQKLVENCLDEEGTVAKVLLYEFLLSERYRFTRLLVLLKWYCRYGGADEFCEEKIAESSSLLALYESSADGLWTVHNKLSDACLPLIPIQSATEILTTGGYSRLPSIVYRNFVSKEFLLSLDEGKTSPSVMQNNDWMGLVSRALLQSCLSKENDLRIFNWKDKQREQAVEVGNRRGGWSLVLMATRIGDHFSWKLLQVRVYIRGASLGGTTDRQSNQVSQSVLSKEQESYLRGICQHILEQNCGSEEESRLYISQAIAESGKFLEEKICVPLALDILRLQAFRLSKNPLFLFKIQKDIDAVLLRFWEDPLSSCTEIRISSLKEDDDMKDENISQQIVEYQNGCSIFVVRRWPFCIYMSLMDSKQRSDSSKDSLLRQVVMNKKSTKILSKTISEQILDISVQKISIESILFQLLAFKCQFLLERLKDDLTSRQGQELDAKQISLEYESVYLGDREEAVKVAYLIVEISKSLVIRIQMSLISGKLCCYTYEGYAWIKDKRRSTGYTEFSSMDYSGIVQFIIDHQKCIVRTSTYCQTKAVSLVIKEDYFTPRSLNEKLMNAVWDKYGLSCYADLDTCIALSPIGWFGTNESKRSLRSEGYEFYCDTLTPYNLFFVYQKDFHSSWLLTHSLNACLGARWLAIIETRKRQRELETVLEVAPLEWSFQQQLFDSNVKDNCHNGFSYPVEENSMRNIHVMRPLSIPAEKGVFYTSSSGIRRIWFDLAFSLLDEGYGLSWKRLLRRFSEVPWPENQGVRLWHFGGQNLKASLILTYAHGHVCLRRVTGDIFIAQQMSKLIRRISAYPSQFMDLVWKNWRELVVVSRPLCKNITLSSASTGLMKQIPSVYIRVDLRRQHTSRSMMIGTEQVKGEGRTIADFKANNKVNSTEAKLQRQRMLSQSIQHELPLPTIQIFPLTQFSKDACELLEEVLSWSPNHMDHYLDILLDHICFIVACLMLLGNRCFISWSSLFRFEISLPIIKEKERVMFCGFEVGCEESPKSILLKNLGHYMKSPNVGGPATTNKDKPSGGSSGRVPVNVNRASLLWSGLQYIISTSKDELSVTVPKDDQILLRKEDLPIIFERLVRFLEQNKATSTAMRENLGFPLYFCEKFLGKDHYFFVGGGGGAAQTGVPNYIKVVDWRDDRCMIVDEKQLVDVPTSACVFKNYLCVVVGPDICFFSVTKENTLCWQNKFQPDSNLQVRQTIVSCSVVSNLLAVGNDEGRIRIYSLDSTWTDCRPPQTVLVHQKSVADIHFSQDGSLLVSVSLDRSCCVWNSRTGAKIITLDSPPVRRYGIKAHFRCCQFSCVSVVEPGLLYTVDVSLDSGSFISGWRMDTWQPLFCRKVSRDPVTFMSTCSVSGLEYIAVGTNEGDVMIWIHNPYQVQGLLRDASEPKRTSSLVIIEKDNISTQGWLSLINTTQVSNLSLYRFYRKHPLQFLPVTGLSWSTSHQKNSKSSIATLLVTCADGYLRIFEIFPQRNDSMTNVYWLLLPFCVFLLALFYSLLWSL